MNDLGPVAVLCLRLGKRPGSTMMSTAPSFRSALFMAFSVLLPLQGALALGCSSDDAASDSSGGKDGGPAAGTGGSPASGGSPPQTQGGSSSGDAVVGTFSILQNPAVGTTKAYTTVSGKVYSAEYPSDVIETPVASAGGCTTYRYSRQACIEVPCTGSQTCVGPNDCRDKPGLVSVGTVTVAGVGPSALTLSSVNNTYSYAEDIAYPGFDDGSNIVVTASGAHYPAFSLTAAGVAPVTLGRSDYLLVRGQPLDIEWNAGENSEAEVSIELDISKHGGSAGFLQCDTEDTGSLRIPAEPIEALIGLGVAGFPQLTVTRFSRNETQVNGGKIALQLVARAIPTLEVEGTCSCNDSVDCGSCSDSTKTVCDSLRRVCNAP